MTKSYEYALFWRIASEHNPNAWTQMGKATTDHFGLRDIVCPDGIEIGIAWIDDDKEFKLMERSVIRSDWHNEPPIQKYRKSTKG